MSCFAVFASPEEEAYSSWKYLTSKNSEPTLQNITNFLSKYPNWPRENIILKKLEKIVIKKGNSQKILQYFVKNPPITPAGKEAFIATLFRLNHISAGKKELKKLWHHTLLTSGQQSNILTKFKAHLTADDHYKRMNFLMNRQYVKAAQQLLPYLSPRAGAVLSLRTALIRRRKNSGTLYDQSPNYLKNDPYIQKDLVYYYRKTDQDQRAIDTLISSKKPSTDAEAIDWYKHRRIMIRVAFKNNRPDQAYKILKNHGLSSGFYFVEAHGYMGWLSLRHNNAPKQALTHFQAARKKSFMPVSMARGDYWIGRAYKELKNPALAKEHFKKAGQHFYTFYGQLALVEMGQKNIKMPSAPTISRATRNTYNKDILIKTAFEAVKQNNVYDAKSILLHIARRKGLNKDVYSLLAQTAMNLSLYDVGVKIGKIATRKNIFLVKAGYPMLNYFNSHKGSKHISIFRALTRQESEYDIAAKSHVGARGLMQLMPATAKLVSRKLSQPYRRKKLTKDPAYNVLLGTSYLKDMFTRFNGSYVKSLGAYNAGPSRIKKWEESYGKTSPNLYKSIDWIETIPFSETRNYVQRILETLQIYRALEKGSSHIKISTHKDIIRGS